MYVSVKIELSYQKEL